MLAHLVTPDLRLRLVALSGLSPDGDPNKAAGTGTSAEVTADTFWSTAAHVRTELTTFFDGLTKRVVDIRRCCRSQLRADLAMWRESGQGDLTGGSVQLTSASDELMMDIGTRDMPTTYR